MGVVKTLIEKRASLGGTTTLANPAEWLINGFRGKNTKAGVRVDEETALGIPAVWGCQKVIAQDVGSLPLILHRRRAGGKGKDRATDDPRYRMLNLQSNRQMTRRQLISTTTMHAVGWGNGFLEIERDRADRVIGLWPLLPDRTHPERKAGQKIFYTETNKNGRHQEVELESHRVAHVFDLSYDGVTGISPIQFERESLGLASAEIAYGANFFGRGGRPREVLEMPGKFKNAAQRKEFRRDWDEIHSGLENSSGTVILENDMKHKSISISPRDAEWVLERGFSVQEVCRIFRVQPNMVMNVGPDSARASLEVEAIKHVQYTLMPWLTAWEQALHTALFTEREQESLFPKFNVEGLLRGDAKARSELYSALFQTAALSPDEILELEDRNPIPDGKGEKHFVPLNMVPLESLDEPEPGDDDDDEPALPRAARREYRNDFGDPAIDSRARLQEAHMRPLKSAAARVLRREIPAVRKALKQFTDSNGDLDKRGFGEWLSDFYAEHKSYVRDQLLPVLESLAMAVWGEAAAEIGGNPTFGPSAERQLSDYGDTAATRVNASGESQLRAVATAAEPAEAPAEVEARLSDWEEKRADKIAVREARQAGNVFALWSWAAAGVGFMVWRTGASPCPLCRQLEGRRVPIDSSFVDAGEKIDPEDGVTAPLTARRHVRHPQLHEGCDCQLSPGI